MLRILLFIVFLAFPLFAGYLASSLFVNSAFVYNSFMLPPYAPPASLFAIAWTILYTLMGISSFIIATARVNFSLKLYALMLYIIQLVVNVLWTYFFFNQDMKLFSFFWIVFLFILVVCMAKAFRRISKLADNMLIPYLLWLIYAAYLNLGIYYLN